MGFFHDKKNDSMENRNEGNKKVDQNTERDRFYRTLGCILRVCELAGYELEEHIVLRDKGTGRIWR